MSIATHRLPKAERRATLVAAASELFAQRGYDYTSLDELAAKVCVTKPIVYRHFASKKDLYLELLRLIEPPLLDEVMRRLQGNRWVAAQWLGLNRATVRKKLALYGLHQQAPDTGSEEEEETGE